MFYLEQVVEQHKRFKEGQELLQDDERKRRPSTSRTEESMEIIQKRLAKDGTSSVRMLEMAGINRETIHKICKIIYILVK
jgi:chromatin segregation and condensation protein Rec8/ScpA/Scc1 (kleisin family)